MISIPVSIPVLDEFEYSFNIYESVNRKLLKSVYETMKDFKDGDLDNMLSFYRTLDYDPCIFISKNDVPLGYIGLTTRQDFLYSCLF